MPTMQHYRNDHYESEPLDSQNYYESSPRHPNQPANHYSPPSPTPYHDAPSPVRANHPSSHPDSAFNRMQPVQDNYSQGRSASPYSGSAGYDSPRRPSPSHHDQGYDQGYDNRGYNNNNNNNNNQGYYNNQAPAPG